MPRSNSGSNPQPREAAGSPAGVAEGGGATGPSGPQPGVGAGYSPQPSNALQLADGVVHVYNVAMEELKQQVRTIVLLISARDYIGT